MRIIGGQLRGRHIAAPKGRATRPMLDRVREAMFSTLSGWLPDARVLDLFAGSGSLGLEALSRGAHHARLVERDAKSAALLAENVRELGVEERSVVVTADALDPASWGGSSTADVVFFDPPYRMLDEPEGRSRLLRAVTALVREVLRPEGVLVFHTPRGALGASAFEPDLQTSERRYGTNVLWYVQRRTEVDPE